MRCWEVVVKLVLGWRHRKLVFGLHVAKGLILVSRTASVVGDMRSPTIFTLWFSFLFVWTVFVLMSFTTHNTFLVFGTSWCLVPKTLASEALLDRGCCPKFLDPENYACAAQTGQKLSFYPKNADSLLDYDRGQCE